MLEPLDILDYPLTELKISEPTPESLMYMARTLTDGGGYISFGLTDHHILFSEELAECEERGICPITVGMTFQSFDKMFAPSTISSRYSTVGRSSEEKRKLENLLLRGGKPDVVGFVVNGYEAELLEHFRHAVDIINQEGYNVKNINIALHERLEEVDSSLKYGDGAGHKTSLILTVGPYVRAEDQSKATRLENWISKYAKRDILQIEATEKWPEAVDCGPEGIKIKWTSDTKKPAEEVKKDYNALITKSELAFPKKGFYSAPW